jgi:sterol desaturase/sphingolipid hydroxylase (fatty acid hydroxylase superfamily)
MSTLQEPGVILARSAQRSQIASWAGVATLILLVGFVVYLTASVSPVRPAGPLMLEITGALSEGWHAHSGRKLVYVVAILCLLLGERAMPAVRSHAPLSTCFFTDLVYAGLTLLTWNILLPVYHSYLVLLYEHSVGRLAWSPHLELPWAWSVVLAFLLADLVAWSDHLLRHKIPFFWQFHAVHHSQEEMSPLTDYRVHPVDFLVVTQIRIIPLALLANSLNLVSTYVFASWLLPKIYHANLRTKFGPLRYVFVTPQSHRVHHSREHAHADTNFGVIFSIWDRLFGTQFTGCDVYPETGISDVRYPNERGRTMAAVPSLLLRQLAHPILCVVRRPGSQPGGGPLTRVSPAAATGPAGA